MQESTIDLSLFRDALFVDDAALAVWNLDTDAVVFEDAEKGIFGAPIRRAIANGTFSRFEFIRESERADVIAAVDEVSRALAGDGQCSRKHLLSCNFVCEDGSTVWCDLRLIGRVEDSGERHVVVVLRNDDEDYRAAEELRQRADVDAMTGVCSKQRTRELIEQHLSRPGAKGALLLFDLDHFKDVNDTFGHLVGDAVITDMALCLQSTFRDSDVVGRVGGDEFVAFMPNVTDTRIVEQRSEAVRARLNRTFEHAKGSFTLTCSSGIAFAPADGTDYDKLFEHADAALYYSKEHGRDMQVRFQEGMKMSELAMANVDSDDTLEVTLQGHPVEFIFRMLFETGDAKMTADLLLELFGKQFNVQRTFVYYRLPDGSWTCFFDWHDDAVTPPYVAHEGIVTDFINMNYRRTPTGLYSELDDAGDTSPDICATLEERGIFAFLHAGIMNGDDKFGCVGMDDCAGSRAWTDQEKAVLRTFADILGAFLVRQMNEAGEVDPHSELSDVLECVNRPIFIIDGDSGALTFANAKARELFGVPDDYSDSSALPLDHVGFSVIRENGTTAICHVLD